MASKELVWTLQVSLESFSRGRWGGRFWKMRREGVKRVKPVSFGEGVTEVKNWNLQEWVSPGSSDLHCCAAGSGLTWEGWEEASQFRPLGAPCGS